MNETNNTNFIKKHNEFIMEALKSGGIDALWMDHRTLKRQMALGGIKWPMPLLAVSMSEVWFRSDFLTIRYDFGIYSKATEGVGDLMEKFFKVAHKITPRPFYVFRKGKPISQAYPNVIHHWKTNFVVEPTKETPC